MLTKEAVDAIHEDLWHGHANVDFSRDKRTEARTVDALCRTALALYGALERAGLRYDVEHQNFRCVKCSQGIGICDCQLSDGAKAGNAQNACE